MASAGDSSAPAASVVGVIYPPPDIRTIADKTAEYVAENGPEFEAKIMATNVDNQKFRFLRMGDPFHAYYQMKLQEFVQGTAGADAGAGAAAGAGDGGGSDDEEGGDGDVGASAAADDGDEKSKEEDDAPDVTTVVKAAVRNPLAVAMSKIDADVKPPDRKFNATHPQNRAAVQLDIIKLTAQFTAVAGVKFLYGITSRESANPQFDFVKTSNSLFPYFRALVEQYRKCLKAPDDLDASTKALQKDRTALLERAVHRLEYSRIQEERKALDQAEEDAERMAFLQIDWHDFVVVETIEFDDVQAVVPVGAGVSAGAGAEAELEEEGEEEMEIEMEMDAEDQDDEEPAAPPSAAADTDAGIKIRTDYVPKIRRATERGITHFIDPVTGQQVPIQQSGEHMRVNLLDPKWAEQRDRSLAKHKDSAYTAGDAIAENLKELASQRPDVFGGDEVIEKEPASSDPRASKKKRS